MNNIKEIFNKDSNPLKNIFKKNPDSGTYFSKETTDSASELYTKYKSIFNVKVQKTVVLKKEDEICAKIAQISYKSPLDRVESINGYHYNKELSTAAECIYFNPEIKNVIFGIRGTVITDVKDITSDVQLILNIQNIDPRVQQVLDMYDTIKREYQNCTIRVCGHSLGGTLSYIIGKHRNPDRCVVFNPGVSINNFFLKMLQDTFTHKNRVKKTYTYKILGDIVSSIAFVGNTEVYFIKASDPLKLHTIDNFVIGDI